MIKESMGIQICINCGAWYPYNEEHDGECPDCLIDAGWYTTSLAWRKDIHKGKNKFVVNDLKEIFEGD